MSAVAVDSENELRRSGGFELIFPVASTANKYFKFFDGPRPLERMLANSTHVGDAASGKTALKGVRAWRSGVEKRGSRRAAKAGRNGRVSQGQGCASSASPVRELEAL